MKDFKKAVDRKILGETNKLTFENTMKNFMIEYIYASNSSEEYLTHQTGRLPTTMEIYLF